MGNKKVLWFCRVDRAGLERESCAHQAFCELGESFLNLWLFEVLFRGFDGSVHSGPIVLETQYYVYCGYMMLYKTFQRCRAGGT